jgi:SAM-dependent methyltransferase
MDVATQPKGLLAKLRRIKYSIASTGLRRGLSDVATLFLSYSPESDQSFDRKFGTDTAGSVPPSQLGIADAAARENAILYLPSPASVTRWMFDNVGIDHRDFSFVDLGCGKGRVLLVAAEYPFKRIVGVEISAALTEIARKNAALAHSRSGASPVIEIQNTNVTTFDFPSTNILLHLYHPFEPAITAAVLSRLERSVEANPRRIVVAYLLYAAALEPVEEVFSRFPWLTKTRYEQSVLGQYNWLFYSNREPPPASSPIAR